MKSIEISTNIGCKNMCKCCPQAKIIKKYKKKSDIKNLKFEDFKKIINKVPRDLRMVSFSGFSEPFLNPECSEMIRYASDLGFKIVVFTTGVGMSLKDIEMIKDIDFFLFRIHVPDDQITMNLEVDKDYLEILEELFKNNINKIQCVCMGEGKIVKKVEELIDKYGIDKKKVRLNNRSGNIEFISKKEKIKGKILGCMHWQKPVVLPNGDVFLCCNDYNLDHYLGNLLKNSYESLFEGEEFKKIEKSLENEDIESLCRYCSYAIRR